MVVVVVVVFSCAEAMFIPQSRARKALKKIFDFNVMKFAKGEMGAVNGIGADGTGLIYVYDMNCPGVEPTGDCPGGERTIRLDLRGKVLSAQECCPNPQRGKCTTRYTPPTRG